MRTLERFWHSDEKINYCFSFIYFLNIGRFIFLIFNILLLLALYVDMFLKYFCTGESTKYSLFRSFHVYILHYKKYIHRHIHSEILNLPGLYIITVKPMKNEPFLNEFLSSIEKFHGHDIPQHTWLRQKYV